MHIFWKTCICRLPPTAAHLSASVLLLPVFSKLEVHWSNCIVANTLTIADTTSYMTLINFAPDYETSYYILSALCLLGVGDCCPCSMIYHWPHTQVVEHRLVSFGVGLFVLWSVERGQPHCCDVWCCCSLCGVGVERLLNQWYWKQVCIISSSKQWLMGHCQAVKEG